MGGGPVKSRAKRLWISLAALVVVALIAGGAYLGYEHQQRRAGLAQLSPMVKQVTVRLEESFAADQSMTMTYKELFARMERYIAATDDKILELRTLDTHRVKDEAAFVGV